MGTDDESADAPVPSWIEAAAEFLADAEVPDPWGDTPADAVPLTDDQRSFLVALSQQPPVPRLSDLDEETLLALATDDDAAPGNGTGGETGDSPGAP